MAYYQKFTPKKHPEENGRQDQNDTRGESGPGRGRFGTKSSRSGSAGPYRTSRTFKPVQENSRSADGRDDQRGERPARPQGFRPSGSFGRPSLQKSTAYPSRPGRSNVPPSRFGREEAGLPDARPPRLDTPRPHQNQSRFHPAPKQENTRFANARPQQRNDLPASQPLHGAPQRTQRFGPRPSGFGRPGTPSHRFGPGPSAPSAPPVVPQGDFAQAPSDSRSVPGANTQPENIIYGRNPIREALKANRDLEKLLVARGDLSGSARELLSQALAAGVNVQHVDKIQLDRIASNHQGMIAFVSAHPYAAVEDILALAKQKNEPPFLVLLDQVTDPQNLGAIIRTAACAGAHGVVVPLHRAVGLTPAAVKASAGAVEYVKVARVTSIHQTIGELKKQGLWVYGADVSGNDYRKVDFSGPCVLVIGSEGSGISPLTRKLCDHLVSIPMAGPIGSLNASVAAGILMYAIYQGRQKE